MDHVRVYNNLFMTTGESYTGDHFRGVYVAAQGGEGNEDMDDVVIVNNTFVDVGYAAISVSSWDAGARFTNFVIKNNIVYNCYPVSFIGFDFDDSDVDFDYNIVNAGTRGRDLIGWNGEDYTIPEFNALFGKSNISSAPTFVDYSPAGGLSNDLHLSHTDTAARDRGVDLSAYIADDKDGISRPQGAGWDIGAYEFAPDLDLLGAPGDQTIYLNWTVNTTLPAVATWRIDYYTTTASAPFTATDPLSITRAYTLTGLTNYQTYTVTLSAMVGATPILSDTVRVMPTNLFVYLPITAKED
jgi:hypothetical protein